MIEIHCTLDREEIARAQDFTLLRGQSRAGFYKVIGGFLALYAALAALNMARNAYTAAQLRIVGTFVGIGAAATLLLVGLRRWISIRGLAKPVEFTLRVTDEGVDYQSGRLIKHTDWSAVTEIVEDDHTIYLFYGEAGMRVVPKRVFGTPDEADAFVGFVKDHQQPNVGHTGAPDVPRSWP